MATLTVTSSDYMKSRTVACEILLNGVSKAKNSSKGKDGHCQLHGQHDQVK